MLKINVQPGENIDRALKRLKRKVRNTKQRDLLRNNRYYLKKSDRRRREIAKARYKEYLYREDNI